MRTAFIACVVLGIARAETPPLRVDNSASRHFPPILKQVHDTCAQDVGIYSMLSYEWNRAKNLAGADPRHQLAPAFAWNLLNRGQNRGTELVEGWQIAAGMGSPTVAAFGQPLALGQWMDGYERYFEAMRHRVERFDFLPLATLADLERAKRWLWNRQGAAGQGGGLLALEARFEGRAEGKLPAGQHEAGKTLISAWGERGRGHVMTVVGYDDSVGHDANGDGAITSDRDITGDRQVTLADHEQGAFLVANSYGIEWGDAGKAYVLYRAAAVSGFQRGRWLGRVFVREHYQPRLTLRARLWCSDASALRLEVSAKNGNGQQKRFLPLLFHPSRRLPLGQPTSPERYGRFSKAGPRLAATAMGSRERPIELGVDLTDALPARGPFTLAVSLADSSSRAEILAASILAYDEQGAPAAERAFIGLPLMARARPARATSAAP